MVDVLSHADMMTGRTDLARRPFSVELGLMCAVAREEMMLRHEHEMIRWTKENT